MITSNRTDILPYDRNHYNDFLVGEPISSVNWYGVSFQVREKGKEFNLADFIRLYDPWFKKVISTFERGSSWIINHDKIDLEWFPNNEDNLRSLRNLFKQNDISANFRGALICSEDLLMELSKDLISYPYGLYKEEGLFYSNIDISHRELPFVIKVLDHLNIDLLSTDEKLLRKVVSENKSDSFLLKPYRGTSL
ncbi:hypothetical protein [Sphingobacterium sp. UME9]|uniref:hypothetical protein n=1 Tax=Sphingobacterium sp. UME9 TaxID=1862316 RepID=UPI001604205C|nr:hypothetical protein [Sphingobacterium sp. UME9]MBB1644861.1 hypothetical protein [Sphingobacterium sp. UME9]